MRKVAESFKHLTSRTFLCGITHQLEMLTSTFDVLILRFYLF